GGRVGCPMPQPAPVPHPVLRRSVVHTSWLWFCSHPPAPLHPAVVHASPSVSAHGVLFDANRCDCTHTPSPAVFSSHPAVVHVFPSVSPHGVLAGCAVHFPVVVSHPLLH